jgi:hypothetical protein
VIDWLIGFCAVSARARAVLRQLIADTGGQDGSAVLIF